MLRVLAVEQELYQSYVVALDLEEGLEIAIFTQVEFHVPETAQLGIDYDIGQEHDPVHGVHFAQSCKKKRHKYTVRAE